jgi:predicted ATP-dependent endonuclease of OLD family
MKTIKRIKLHNFKRFKEFSVDFDDKLNLLIGDNEAGKSSILLAVDIVLSGSVNKIETIGLDSLFNSEIILEFLNSEKKYNNLPNLYIELFLNEQNNPDLNGKYNSEDTISDGLLMICKPNDELSKEIAEILKQPEPNFPFEFYTVNFKTFKGESYSPYKKYLRHISIDSSQISNEYATKAYIKEMYYSNIRDEAEKSKYQNEYRKFKEKFKNDILVELNSKIDEYSFSIKNNSKANLETDLTIEEDNITIENKGKGRQCFIKTEFALRRTSNINIDILLLEEPENHLSHINMKKLIKRIFDNNDKQLFITTHNSMISNRLDLRKSILLNSNSAEPVLLNMLTDSTAKFFMKAPDNNMLEFILSKKIILVEGDAEYILMEAFFKNETGLTLDDAGVHIISVDGTSFKRYLDIAILLAIKTAVIRDNDKDYQNNCIHNYEDYSNDSIKIFADINNNRSTFEICLYEDNIKICDDLFLKGRKTLSVQDFMIQNKAEVAFEILDKKGCDIIAPQYIKDAIKWIKE